jgi:hypothetical protein
MAHRAAAAAYAALFDTLLTSMSSVAELVKESGMHENSVRKFIQALRRRKQSHVGGWEQDRRGRFTVKLHMLGPGRDAPCPRKSVKEVNANYYAKLRKVDLKFSCFD